MKNIFKITVMSCLLLALPIKESKAVVGLVTGNLTMAIKGLAFFPIAYGISYACAAANTCTQGGILKIFGISGLLGIILLEDGSTSLEFKSISSAEAEKMDIALEDMTVYNEELEENNLVFQEVASHLNNESTYEDAKGLWNEYKELLSEESFNVMSVLANQK